MKVIKCPKCGKQTELNISHALTSDGEAFQCKYCKYPFRYVDK